MPKKLIVNMGPSIPFNPLAALAATAAFKSESAVQNMVAGICPKCHQTMTGAQVANGDRVHWCPKCCVASPLPDGQ